MVDMHIHTVYSDGNKTVEEILKMCEEKKLKYISITDHDTCKQYDDISLNPNKIFNGKIIKGVELRAIFQGYSIEVLGYNVNPKIINEWCEKRFSKDQLIKIEEFKKAQLLKMCDEKGLIYNIEKVLKPENFFRYIEMKMYDELMSYEENIEKLGELAKNFQVFFRNGLRNPESEFFLDPSSFMPQYTEIIDLIHKAGGKVFLAHPYDYQLSDTIKFLDDLRKTKELDGIECFHPTSEKDNRSDILIKYARDNNLYISGGSDYHGDLKPDVEIGIGKGSIKVSKEYIEEWVNK